METENSYFFSGKNFWQDNIELAKHLQDLFSFFLILKAFMLPYGFKFFQCRFEVVKLSFL